MTTIPPINLGKLPKKSAAIYKWSDYIELLCLFNKDGVISKSDILGRIHGSNDIDLPDEIEEDTQLTFSTMAEENDEANNTSQNWYRQLAYRVGAFDDFYPFLVDNDQLSLKSDITVKHKFYIYLLLASSLPYVHKEYHSKLTNSFEIMSKETLKQYLPSFAEVHIFGTGKDDDKRYAGNMWTKINQLAKDIRVYISNRISEKDFSKNDVGDGGLDIVAWLPTGDKNSGLISVFGQCACTDDWVNKQISSHTMNWRPKLEFIAEEPNNMVFIPFCFRDSHGEWAILRKILESIVFDRLRIIFFLKDKMVLFEKHPIFQEIEHIINYREAIV